jgi:predicted RNA-binding protein with RPS1 domain
LEHQQHGDNPWTDAERRYLPGQEVAGTVTRVTQFGVFVQLETGLEGIIYAFELGASSTDFAPGQTLQLLVSSIDASKKRLELSLHQNPLPGPLHVNELPPEVQRERLSRNQHRVEPFNLPDLPDLSAGYGWQMQQARRPQKDLPGAFLLAATADNRPCPTCMREIQAVWKYCVYCGGSLRRHCPACKTMQPDLPDAHYCCECGSELQ